ncbi:MAG TPA: tail fiber domain-containing protein [Candidatus Paceibacterota bacterium]|nr:tail fiber domain-containing protein [Candidatus Paceibacterota bacterium]
MQADLEKQKIPSNEAAKLFGVTGDYVTLLCRRGKVEGELHGRTWHVSAWSLEKYLRQMKNEKEARKAELSETLKREYHAAAPERKPKAKAKSSFAPIFRYQALAPLAMLVVFVGAWSLSFAQSLPLSALADAYQMPAHAGKMAVVEPLIPVGPAARANAAAALLAARNAIDAGATMSDIAAGAQLAAAAPLALGRAVDARFAFDIDNGGAAYNALAAAASGAFNQTTAAEFGFAQHFVDWTDSLADAQAAIYATLADAVGTDMQNTASAVAFWNNGASVLATTLASVPLAFAHDMSNKLGFETARTYGGIQSAGAAVADAQARIYYDFGNSILSWTDAMGDAQARIYQTLGDSVATQVSAAAAALSFWSEGSITLANNVSHATASANLAFTTTSTASVWSAINGWWQSLFGNHTDSYATETTTVQSSAQEQPATSGYSNSPAQELPEVLGSTASQPPTLVVAPAPSYQFLASNYVTQSSLTDQLNQLGNSLRSLIYSQSGSGGSGASQGSTVGYGQYSTGGYTNNLALSQVPSTLNGITITNATITGSTFNGSSTGGASALSALTDVSASSPAWGDLLEFNGTQWVTAATSSLGINASIGSLYASTTIGDSTPAGGLTISGGATTTGNAYFGGNVYIGGYDPLETLFAQKSINNSRGVRYTLSNTNTSGQSYAGAILYANNQTVASQFYADGLGTGPLGTPGFYIGNFSNHPIGFFTNNTEKARFTAAGNFGIGTTSPASILSIAGTSGLFASTTATSTFQGGGINLITAAGNTGCFAINGICVGGGAALTGSLGQLAYFSGSNTAVGTSSLYITSAGSIAAGTTSPYARLTVWGGSSTAGNALEIANSASTSILTVSNAGVVSIGANGSNAFTVDASSGTTTIANLSIGNLTFDTDAGVVALSNIPVDSNAAAGVIQSQSINIGDTSVLTVYGESNGSGGVQNLRVGIGTTSPYSALSVVGTVVASLFNATSTATSTFAGPIKASCFSTDGSTCLASGGGNSFSYLFPNNATSTGLGIFASSTIGNGNQTSGLTINGGATTTGNAYVAGNVGIGVASPAVALDVSGTGAFTNGIFARSGTFSYTNGTGLTAAYDSSNDRSYLFSGNTTGSVVVSTKPFYLYGSKFTFTNNNSTSNFTVDTTGNVGVGTSSPLALLTVATPNGSTGATQNLFLIASSTASATTTLFSVSNTGLVTYGSFIANASSTIGNGTQTGGLTVSGGATTTGNAYFAGNVGIGTTNPQDTFHLVGTFRVQDSTTAAQYFKVNNILPSGNYPRTFFQGGKSTSDVNWGMRFADAYSSSGLSIPAFIQISDNNDTTYTNTHTLVLGQNTSNAFIHTSTGSSGTNGLPLYLSSRDDISTPQLVLDTVSNNQNVGIGTSSPYAKLSVVGSIVADSINATSTTATSTFAGGLNVGNGALTYDLNSGITSINNLAIGSLNFDTDAGIVNWTDLPIDSNASAGTVESYTANVGGAGVLTVYGEADGSGNAQSLRVGIGTTSPMAQLTVSQASYPTILLDNSGGSSKYTRLYFSARGVPQFEFGTDRSGNNTSNFYIGDSQTSAVPFFVDSSDLVYISTTTSIGGTAAYLSVLDANGGTAGLSIGNSTGSVNTTAMRFVNSNGIVGSITTSGSATAYNTSSDRRLKDNIVATSHGLDDLLKIDVADFNFKNSTSTTQGFIAQQLEDIYPYAVTTNGDDGNVPLSPTSTPWSVDYGRITPLIVSAVQDIANITSTFKTNLINWLADAQNGIHDLYATIFHAQEVDTQKLCVGSVCVTQEQFLAMVQASGGGGGAPAPDAPPVTPPADDASSTPPTDDAISTPPTVDDSSASSTPPVVDTPPAPDAPPADSPSSDSGSSSGSTSDTDASSTPQ